MTTLLTELNHIRASNSDAAFCGFIRVIPWEDFDLTKDTCTKCVVAQVENSNQCVDEYNAMVNVVAAALDAHEHLTKAFNENLQSERIWVQSGNPVIEEEES